VVVFLSVLGLRLFTLQFVKHDYYTQYAQKNRLQRERIVSPRGLIRDRHGEVVVDNVPRFDVVVRWRNEHDVRHAIARLGSRIPLDTTQVMARLDTWKKRNRGAPFPLVQDADKFEISFIRENHDLYPRLHVQTNARRRYRKGVFGSHLLGYVGEVNDEFLAQAREGNYKPGDLVGTIGIEEVCEKYLRGEDGQRVVAVNAAGNTLGELKELLKPPIPGKDVYLTIDGGLQERLEVLLEPYRAGAAIVMDVEDGAVLAAVSTPQFDPNKFALGITQEDWRAYSEAKDKPLFNRFLLATYPPGSTFKIISIYAILTDRIVDPAEARVYCTGSYRFGNRVFKCWKSWGHGYMNLHDGFVNSCDSYFFDVAKVVDVDDLAAAAREFGLGTGTGIDLPGETDGLVPDREYYNRRYGKGQWTQGLVLNNIIGQGELLVGVLQMCRVAAAIANGGFLVQPHVVGAVEGEREISYSKRKIRNLPKPVIDRIRASMRSVVHGEDGTGRASRVAGLKAAGKTGTSQNPHGEDHAWFIGYAPADEPEIALAIVVENAGHGGAIAAPIAKQVYLEYFDEMLSQLTRTAPVAPAVTAPAVTIPGATAPAVTGPDRRAEEDE
jgi:penicillin-binding protein 2